mmetsp:Transcript_45780/g.89458  ORF Transcript_45780/g.89458 Transcript_45780/m.89458 type:complete len:307 (+) Transcript_45780:72-992(+)
MFTFKPWFLSRVTTRKKNFFSSLSHLTVSASSRHVQYYLGEKILLGQRQLVHRQALQLHPVRGDPVGLRIDLDLWHRVVEPHVLLRQPPAVPHRVHPFAQAVPRHRPRLHPRPRHEDDRTVRGRRRGPPREHGPHPHRLRRGNRRVGIPHLRPGDLSPFEDELRLGPEEGGPPQDQVRELPRLHTPHEVGEAVRNGGVDRVLGDVAPRAEVVDGGERAADGGGARGVRVLGEGPALHLHLVGGLPGAGDDLAHAAHRLGVGGDDGDGAHVLEDVLGGDGLAADAGFGEGDVLLGGFVEVVADHEHV